MIKELYGNDRAYLLRFLQDNADLDDSDARFCIENSDRVIAYENDSFDTVGCGTFRLWGNDKNKSDVYIYVAPKARNAGLGTTLFRELIDRPDTNDLKFISTKVETNHEDSLTFFHDKGFKQWYTERILRYSGKRLPEIELQFIKYKSEYFERYVEAIRSSFYELRRANDFKPYFCCEPNEAKRNELENNKDNIYLLLDGEKLAASVTVNKGSIDNVFVTPEYQGGGIGKKMMSFAVNTAIDSGSNNILLNAIERNVRALHLYESLGFHIVRSMYYLRLFSKSS